MARSVSVERRSVASEAKLAPMEVIALTELETVPTLRQVVLDCTDARTLAEFYRRLLGLVYRPGDEPPEPGRSPGPQRPGARCLTSCRSQPLPSGSLSSANVPSRSSASRAQTASTTGCSITRSMYTPE